LVLVLIKSFDTSLRNTMAGISCPPSNFLNVM
jgi:hypothetical protein